MRAYALVPHGSRLTDRTYATHLSERAIPDILHAHLSMLEEK